MSLRTDVIGILKSPNCRRINFAMGAIRISGTDYDTVAKCNENRHIQVVQSRKMPAHFALYYRKYKCFVMGGTLSRPLVVHEGTHAVNDWYKRKISDVEDEASAYVAQMVFMLVEQPGLIQPLQSPSATRTRIQYLQRCLLGQQGCNDSAIAEAASLAIDILAGKRMNPASLYDLRSALDRDPGTHTDPATKERAYDGILRVEIPTDYLRQIDGTVIDP